MVWWNGAWLFFDFTTGSYDGGSNVYTGAGFPGPGGGGPQYAPLDYDGDGDVDFAVFNGGAWHFYNDNGTYNKSIWTGGVVNDMPLSRRQLLHSTP